MKAKMSDTYGRLAHYCAAPAPHETPVHIDEWLVNDMSLKSYSSEKAIDEARAILAEAEPGVEGWGFLPFPTSHPWRNGRGEYVAYLNHKMDDAPRAALAESLAAFVSLEGL